MRNPLHALFLAATALSAVPAFAQDTQPPPAPRLEEEFRDPPASARPRVWWHWLNGNVTKDGIAKDLAWMKRIGIGGVQNFNVSLYTPVIVDKRVTMMTPEWREATRFAASEADRLGLEMAVHSSPGWSLTGGPWVRPEDAMKKLVWSETDVVGGKRFTGRLAPPPAMTGPYGTIDKVFTTNSLQNRPADPPYGRDVMVLGVPIEATPPLATPEFRGADGKAIDATVLSDASLTSAIALPRTGSEPPTLTIVYPSAQTVRSASAYLPGDAIMYEGPATLPRLEASDDGQAWRPVANIPATSVPATTSFAPVTARYFRVVFDRIKPGTVPANPLKVGDLRLSGESRVDLFEAKAGFEIERDYYHLSQGVAEAAGADPRRVIDLTSRMRPDGSLDWTPPKGRWRVLRFGHSLAGMVSHPAPAEGIGLETDKFDAPAVRRHLDHYIGAFREAAGTDLFGKRGISALLTDSVEVGMSNWTPAMVAQFKRLRGYDPVPWMPVLAGVIVGSRAQSDKFLYDYRRTLSDLVASEHYGTVAKVAHENGLIVYGEALEGGRGFFGDDMEMRSHADIPMSAMWSHTREEGPKPGLITDIKGAASVASVYGRKYVANEAMTSANNLWGDSPATLKRAMDLTLVTGVNRPVIHTSIHQPRDDIAPGLAVHIFGQYFTRHEAWAEMARPWIDYIARNSLLLQQGRSVVDVAYFYGEEAPLAGLYDRQVVADAPRANGYDFVNADILANALANDDADLVTPGGARYRALYLGGTSREMTLPTLRRIAALVEGGATVVGLRPEADPGLATDAGEWSALARSLWNGDAVTRLGRGQVIASNDIAAALARIGVAPDFRHDGATDAEIAYLHRRFDAGGGDGYFLVNRRDRTETIEARFRVTGKAPELWHADSGRTEAVSYRIEGDETIVPLTLAPDEAVHVVFRKPATAPALAIKTLAPVEVGQVAGSWKIAFQPGRGAPAQATMASLAPLNESAEPGIRYFSGVATYASDFTAPRDWKAAQPLWVDLGEVREIAEVLINGRSAGIAWHAPYRVDVSALARPGSNRIEVRVANLWVNRLIGDQQPGAKKIAWTFAPTYTAEAPLRRSGLIGPVRLLGQR